MAILERKDILDFVTYAERRDAIRASAMAAKEPRRVHLGDRLTFLFENRETIRYQVLEMVRAEQMVREDDIQHELDTYNAVLGGEGELDWGQAPRVNVSVKPSAMYSQASAMDFDGSAGRIMERLRVIARKVVGPNGQFLGVISRAARAQRAVMQRLARRDIIRHAPDLNALNDFARVGIDDGEIPFIGKSGIDEGFEGMSVLVLEFDEGDADRPVSIRLSLRFRRGRL